MKEAWFLADPATDPGQLPEHGWQQVALPHQWALESGDEGAEIESGWYRLEFPEATGRRWGEIRADYYCEAWVGGVYKGRHEGYFEPWVLEIPPEEVLLLRVSAPKETYGKAWPRFKSQIKGVFGQHDCRPGGSTAHGQERGSGGLWGGVRYFRTGPVALLHVNWKAVKIALGWKLWIDLEIDVKPEAPNGKAELLTENGSGTPAMNQSIDLTLLPNNFHGEIFSTQRHLELEPGRHTYSLVWDLPELPRWEVWERGFPYLYELQIQLDEQTESTLTGFRTISQDGDWLVLNEKRLFLRGTNIIPTQWLAEYTAEKAAQDVQLIKEANLNAVRVHAHLTHPYFYEACDQAGVLVWQDFPLQWSYTTDEKFTREAVRQVKAMVHHFGRHASIYQWCAHNEPTHNRHSLDPVLSAALRQADVTRLVKEASDFREHPYPGWYWGDLRDFLAIPGAPLPSEFGAQALPRAELLCKFLGEGAWPPVWETWVYHNFQPDQTFHVAHVDTGESLEDFVTNSQEYQARLLKFAIESYRRAKGKVSGYFQFMFVEPWEGITWAVLDAERFPKEGYFALQQASSPVLLSFVPYRETLEIGQLPLSEAWVINDLARSIDIKVTLKLEGLKDIQLGEFYEHIAAQEARCIFHQGDLRESVDGNERLSQVANALKDLPAGDYRLTGEVWEGEHLLSQNQVHLTYLQPSISTGEGW